MKLNARIEAFLDQQGFPRTPSVNHIDSVCIWATQSRSGQPFEFHVSWREYDPTRKGLPFSEGYVGSTFSVRTSAGDVTDIGRMLGIRARDAAITLNTPHGYAVQEFLYRVARRAAYRLVQGNQLVRDECATLSHAA